MQSSLLLFVWGTLASPPARGDDIPAPAVLRVMSYNIHHGRGMDDKVDLKRIAEVIQSQQPDLVALQEVDNKTRRTNQVDQVAELARLTGLFGIFGKQIDYEGGEYGQAILSRFPLSHPKIHWLPGEPDRERRIAFSVEVESPQQKLIFVGTHLHHMSEEYRKRQVEALNELLDGWKSPVILTGDLNALPDAPPIQILNSRWKMATTERDLLTFPAPQPDRQIDYLVFHPASAFTVTTAKVIPEVMASDHRPVLVELRFAAPVNGSSKD